MRTCSVTSVSRDVLSADDVVEAYRVRWYIELIFKQMKSGAGLDAIRVSTPTPRAALPRAFVPSDGAAATCPADARNTSTFR